MQGKSAYKAFLLRCWQEQTGNAPLWRFSLEEIGGDRKRRGFAHKEDLVKFLGQEIGREQLPKEGN